MNVIESQDRVPDAVLLARYCASRSPQPLEELLRRYYGFVLAVCRRELNNSDLALDAAQEVVLEFVKRADRLEASPSVAPWLFRVAQTRSRDLQRSEIRRRKRDARAKPHEGATTEGLEIQSALESLPEKERELLLARYIGGYSFEEIGRCHNLTPDAVRMRVNRTIDRLKNQLASAVLLLRLEEALTNEPAPPPPLVSVPSKPAVPTRFLPLTAALVGSFATLSLIGKPFASPASPSTSGDPAATAVQRNQVDFEALLPFYAEVESSAGFTSRYWRTNSHIRAIETQGQKQTHVSVSGNESLTMAVLPQPPGPNEGRIIRGSAQRRVMETDAWEIMLLQLPVLVHAKPALTPWSLKEALKGKTGGEVQVSHPDGKRNYRLWLQADRGNMPSKCEYVCRPLPGTEFRFDIQIKEWQKVGTSWFPRRVVRKSYFNGQPSSETTFTLKNVRLGKDLPALPSMPKPAANSIVMDEVRSVWYFVDQNWKRISKETPFTDGNIGG